MSQRLYLDLHHHAALREASNVDENLVALCGLHRRAAQAGELLVEGSPASDGTRSVARSTRTRWTLTPTVFSALHNLGPRLAAC